ncbi:MAG: hypothetical protein ACFB21_00315 [Opitutales bacterium]
MSVDKSFKEPPKPVRRYSKKEWDEVRFGFATSLMVDTKLNALAQNLELDDWPLKGENETPSKYIDYSWDELNDLPGLAGRPQRIDHLIHILIETQSFDDPFGDMVATVDAAATKDDTLTKNLKHLEISEDYPLRLCGLSGETLEFCQAEDIQTLGAFAEFSQNMAQNIIVGGDFRELLNAISSLDGHKLSRYIPFRPGSKGLHFPEAVGLLLNQLSENEKNSLLKKYGFKLGANEAAKARLNKDQVAQLEDIIVKRISELGDVFRDQVQDIYKSLQRGVKVERCFMTINDPEKEAICVPLARRYMTESAAEFRSALGHKEKRGFFARLFGR